MYCSGQYLADSTKLVRSGNWEQGSILAPLCDSLQVNTCYRQHVCKPPWTCAWPDEVIRDLASANSDTTWKLNSTTWARCPASIGIFETNVQWSLHGVESYQCVRWFRHRRCYRAVLHHPASLVRARGPSPPGASENLSGCIVGLRIRLGTSISNVGYNQAVIYFCFLINMYSYSRPLILISY
jgi:hypothetical protein